MPRRKDWLIRPLLLDLRRLARASDGIRDAQLSGCRALLTHPAVRARMDDGRSPSRAVHAAFADAQGALAPSFIDCESVLAARVLLNAVDVVSIPTGEASVPRLSPDGRAELARQIIGVWCTPEHWVKVRDSGAGTGTSPELTALEAGHAALDALEAPPSATAVHAEIGELVRPATGDDLEDLIGTWKGSLKSSWTLRSSDGQRPERIQCYLMVSMVEGVRMWHAVESGCSVFFAPSLTEQPRRILAMYEANTLRADGSWTYSHRGGVVLDTDGPPATALRGTYFTDRGTSGRLVYEEHVNATASTFPEAEALFRS